MKRSNLLNLNAGIVELNLPMGLKLLLMEILFIALGLEILLVVFLGIFFFRKLNKLRKNRKL